MKFSSMTLARILAAAMLAIFAAGSADAHQQLPLGDGQVSQQPKQNYVYACRSQFRAGGARHQGDWFHGKSWDPSEKPHVRGKIVWPNAEFSVSEKGPQIELRGNGLPTNQVTGIFPIAADDPAYAFDTNPNAIEAKTLSFSIPLKPMPATEPQCLPMGMIGITLTGVALYSALDDAGRDAAAHEIQDICDGHPQGAGQYHYHSASPCLPGADKNQLVGWALDGYPILGMRDAQGKRLNDADLDACHGRAENVAVDGRQYKYAYRLTREYPYTLGCFHGKIEKATFDAIHRALGPPRRGKPDGHRRRAP